MYQYLEDWLLLSKSTAELCRFSDMLLDLMQRLGLIVNFTKSELSPTEEFNYLGARFFLRQGRVGLSEERKMRLRVFVEQILLGPHALTVRIFLQDLGVMASCIGLLPQVWLRMHPLQLFLLHFWKPTTRDLPFGEHLRPHLLRRLQEVNLCHTVRLREVPLSWVLVMNLAS